MYASMYVHMYILMIKKNSIISANQCMIQDLLCNEFLCMYTLITSYPGPMGIYKANTVDTKPSLGPGYIYKANLSPGFGTKYANRTKGLHHS